MKYLLKLYSLLPLLTGKIVIFFLILLSIRNSLPLCDSFSPSELIGPSLGTTPLADILNKAILYKSPDLDPVIREDMVHKYCKNVSQKYRARARHIKIIEIHMIKYVKPGIMAPEWAYKQYLRSLKALKTLNPIMDRFLEVYKESVRLAGLYDEENSFDEK